MSSPPSFRCASPPPSPVPPTTRRRRVLPPLFNGKDLTGWKGLVAPIDNPAKRAKLTPEQLAKAQKEADDDMRAHWKVEDGVLVFDGKGRSLCTAKDYGDFEMWCRLEDPAQGRQRHLSPRHAAGADLGPEPRKSAPAACTTTRRTPASRRKSADKPVGEWNTFYIKMVGDKVTVKLNGETGRRQRRDGELLGARQADLSDRPDRAAEPRQHAVVQEHLHSRTEVGPACRAGLGRCGSSPPSPFRQNRPTRA